MKFSVLRDDLVHPFMMGNKWRKLKYNLIDFKNSGKNTLVTFGGAFSNHLIATAAAAKEYGFQSVGIVRGEDVKNPYIEFMQNAGMKLIFISRENYRKKEDGNYLKTLIYEMISKNILESADDAFFLPEGGANESAVKGAKEIMDDIQDDSDYIVCACGTGATLAGISRKLLPHQKAVGIAVLKAENYFEKQIQLLGGFSEKTEIIYDYHFGGYAKTNKQLELFCKKFSNETGILIEPVYTGKVFFAIEDLIRKNYFKSGSKVTLVHTGGTFIFDHI